MKTLSVALAFLTCAAVARAQEEQLPTVAAADAQAVQKINGLGGGAMPLAANTNLLSVNFSLAGAKIDDAALESLKGVGEQLVWLNLAGTSVTDGGIKALAGLKNLRRLHLEKTGVGDEGLASIKGLTELQYLNLYGTKVTDKGLTALAGLKKLKNVYLWQTAVTDGGAAELAKALPGVYINRGIDPPAKVVEIAAPAPAPAPAVAAAKPINAKCPLSGKDIDPSKTSTYKTQLIAFCCDNCKGKFDAEPAKFIGKVAEFKEPAAAKKAFNAKCPRNDLDVVAGITLEHKGVVIGFCSDECKNAFPNDPDKYINRYPAFKEAYEKAVKAAEKKDEKKSDAGNVFNVSFVDPINKKCPITGKDVNPTKTSEYEKQLIGFCCDDCKGKFETDPKKYIGKVKEFKKSKLPDEEISFVDPINKKCPITGKDIVAGKTSEYEKQLIGFCCENCVGKFESDPRVSRIFDDGLYAVYDLRDLPG